VPNDNTHSGLNRPGWLTSATIVIFAAGVLRFISALYLYISPSADLSAIRADSTNVSAGAFGRRDFRMVTINLKRASL
jgi:hypothetical protein